MDHVSDANAAKEIEVAVAFDVRDNPKTKEILDQLIKQKGNAGLEDWKNLVLAEIKREYEGDKGPTLFPWTRAAVRTLITGGALYHEWGLGQIGALIGGVLTAGIQAATSIYTTKLQVNAQKDITQLQINQVNAQAAAQQAAAKAAAAASASGTSSNPLTAISSMFTAPDTNTLLLVGMGILGIFVLPKFFGTTHIGGAPEAGTKRRPAKRKSSGKRKRKKR